MIFLKITIYQGANVNLKDFHVNPDLLYDQEKCIIEI